MPRNTADLLAHQMALVLRERNRHHGLDLGSDADYIRVLTSRQYHSGDVLVLLNDAMARARDGVVAVEMART